MFRRKSIFSGIMIFGCIGYLSGCATTTTTRVQIDPDEVKAEEARQKENYVRTIVEAQNRVQKLAYPMIRNAVSLCGDETRSSLGFVPTNIYAWQKAYREAATEVWGAEQRATIGLILEPSPAAEAGLMERDVLISVAGKAVPHGKWGPEKAQKLIRKYTDTGEPVEIVIEREGVRQTYTLTPEAVCNSYAHLTNGDEVNAYADGQRIYITMGMLRFVESDLELATVIGHELAHNAMSHIDKKTSNFLLGSILDIAAAAYGVNTQSAFGNAAAQAYSQDFEAEADYVGLYILALGGYDTHESPGFWRKMSLEHPGAITSQYNATHPGTAERYLALEEITQEIDRKIESGGALVPEMK